MHSKSLFANSRIFSVLGTAGLLTLPALAGSVPVQNFSFESPAGPFPGTGVSTTIDIWQKTPQPVWFDPDDFGGIGWTSLSGIFPNAPSGDRHITNADGDQVAFFLVVPAVGISQVLGETVQAGMSYNLSLGLRGGGALTAGSTFYVGLFYLDGTTPVTLAAQNVSAGADYATRTTLDEISVNTGVVSSAAIGKPLGITVAVSSTNGVPGNAYWEMDKVQVTVVPEPEEYAVLAGAALLGGAIWRRWRQKR